MKGYVELSKENGLDLISKCLQVMESFVPEQRSETKFSLLKMKNVTTKYSTNIPHWFGYEKALKCKFDSLKDMLNKPDPVHLSLDCYKEIILLSKGDRRANPIFILSY